MMLREAITCIIRQLQGGTFLLAWAHQTWRTFITRPALEPGESVNRFTVIFLCYVTLKESRERSQCLSLADRKKVQEKNGYGTGGSSALSALWHRAADKSALVCQVRPGYG